MHCVRAFLIIFIQARPKFVSVQSVLVVIQTSYSKLILQYLFFEAHKLIFFFFFTLTKMDLTLSLMSRKGFFFFIAFCLCCCDHECSVKAGPW